MPEAVIVATARSPIGRAQKGSLKDLRPDDLAATMVRAALDQVPALHPTEIGDLMLGCAQPAGEQGYTMARVVATMLGFDHPPGPTLNRTRSSLRTASTRGNQQVVLEMSREAHQHRMRPAGGIHRCRQAPPKSISGCCH